MIRLAIVSVLYETIVKLENTTKYKHAKIKKNTKDTVRSKEGGRMYEDGRDFHRLRKAYSKNKAKIFKVYKLRDLTASG